MPGEETPFPEHFQDTRSEEPDELGSPTARQVEVCSSEQRSAAPWSAKRGGSEEKPQPLRVVLCGSEAHREEVQTFGPGLRLRALCALSTRSQDHRQPPAPDSSLSGGLGCGA